MSETPEQAVARVLKQRESTKSTPEKKKTAKERFLEAFEMDGTVTGAAKAAGVDRKTVYNWRDSDEAFAEAWEDAKEAGIESLEREARRRAKSRSDTLLIFLLKAARPEVYAENRGGESDARPVTFNIFGGS